MSMGPNDNKKLPYVNIVIHLTILITQNHEVSLFESLSSMEFL